MNGCCDLRPGATYDDRFSRSRPPCLREAGTTRKGAGLGGESRGRRITLQEQGAKRPPRGGATRRDGPVGRLESRMATVAGMSVATSTHSATWSLAPDSANERMLNEPFRPGCVPAPKGKIRNETFGRPAAAEERHPRPAPGPPPARRLGSPRTRRRSHPVGLRTRRQRGTARMPAGQALPRRADPHRTGRTHLRLRSEGGVLPTPRDASPDDMFGRGLFTVREVADRRGVERLTVGKSVWCELDVVAVEGADARPTATSDVRLPRRP